MKPLIIQYLTGLNLRIRGGILLLLRADVWHLLHCINSAVSGRSCSEWMLE